MMTHGEILQRRCHRPARVCCAGPGQMATPYGLGWQIEHVLAYFAVTPIVCLAWHRPFLVGEPSWASVRCWRACKQIARQFS